MDPNSVEPSNGSSKPSAADSLPWLRVVFACSLALAVLARLIHHDLIWVEEAYGLAAAAEVLRGKVLYRDIWFDKPPLYAWFYLLCGAQPGWPLRILAGLHILAVGWSVKWTGQQLWGIREGLVAAALCCFSLTFWIPSAIMAAAPDLLMIVPHVLAVGLAVRRRWFLAGILSGIALLINPRAVFVLAASALWGGTGLIVIGFATVQLTAAVALPFRDYWQQVWSWGFVYSSATFLHNPLREAAVRTFAWAGFHLTTVTGALITLLRERQWRLALWIILSAAAVVAGLRFFPRYYFQLLPVVSLGAGRGFLLLSPRWRAVAFALLLIPALRFGPRYVSVALNGTSGWADAAMMEDSRDAARHLQDNGDRATLLVWGYRPDVFVFSGLPAGTRFLDSQPLTGVLADRHLTDSTVLYPEIAAANRAQLVQTTPIFIVDGLGPLNPSLAITEFEDLHDWLARYEVIARTRMSVIYRVRPDWASLGEER
jgi:hypothetical protein